MYPRLRAFPTQGRTDLGDSFRHCCAPREPTGEMLSPPAAGTLVTSFSGSLSISTQGSFWPLPSGWLVFQLLHPSEETCGTRLLSLCDLCFLWDFVPGGKEGLVTKEVTAPVQEPNLGAPFRACWGGRPPEPAVLGLCSYLLGAPINSQGTGCVSIRRAQPAGTVWPQEDLLCRG